MGLHDSILVPNKPYIITITYISAVHVFIVAERLHIYIIERVKELIL